MIEDTNLSIESILNTLKSLSRYLDQASQRITNISSDNPFAKIKDTIARIDKPATTQAPPPSERYLKQWEMFKRGDIAVIDRSALKYLCWKSEVVEDPEFSLYLMDNIEQLSARAIKGLFMSIHQNWQDDSPGKKIAIYVKDQLSKFSGRDRTIAKWKSSIPMLFGHGGPALFARDILLDSLITPKIASEQWVLEESSGYMQLAVVNAFDQSLNNMGSQPAVTDYVLNVLFDWPKWEVNPKEFRLMVKKLILYPRVESIIDKLKRKILNNRMLGDPRYPLNRNKWSGIDPGAKQKFISWLSVAEIKFFFDIALQGYDPHGRRDFWLKYVDRIIASRPLLSVETAFIIRNNNKDVNYGRLSAGSNKAAFILDFGPLVAVEFSNVGKVYIYTRNEFDQRVPDMWISQPIREARLKDQGLPDGRMIRHVNWEHKVSSILAREGIRP